MGSIESGKKFRQYRMNTHTPYDCPTINVATKHIGFIWKHVQIIRHLKQNVEVAMLAQDSTKERHKSSTAQTYNVATHTMSSYKNELPDVQRQNVLGWNCHVKMQNNSKRVENIYWITCNGNSHTNLILKMSCHLIRPNMFRYHKSAWQNTKLGLQYNEFATLSCL